MEYYHNKLCISARELIQSPDNPDGVLSFGNYKQLCHRGQIKVVRRGCRNTSALVEFDSLPARYRDIIIESLGYDPRVKPVANCIARSLHRDTKAREFFNGFMLANGTGLPPEAIDEYSMNADLLLTIHEMANRIRGQKNRNRSLNGMWQTLADELKALDLIDFPHSLPTNPVRLREKVARFMKEGPVSLIHRGYGNKVAEKLTEPAKEWLLARWANMVERVTSIEHLLDLYNGESDKRGWKKLSSPSTIRNYLFSAEIEQLWHGVRYGHISSKNKFLLQNSTRLPSMRDSLWYSDGTKLNYFYLDDDGKMATCSVYEVMDAYSEVLLGYHISPTEDYQAQYRAYKMAVQFSGHRPYQIGYDNQGGHKKLESGNFLNKIGRLSIRTQPYNGKSKTIESAFGRFQRQFMKKDWFYTGQNITARSKESRRNMEFTCTNKGGLPTLDEVKRIYAQRRQEWNHADHPVTKKPRIEMYHESRNPEAVPVTLLDMVDIFWILRPEPVTLNAYGLSFTDNKTRYDYLVYKDGTPDVAWHMDHIDRKFYIKYDPDDMSMIYLYLKDSKGSLRFVTEAMTKVTVARGKQEQTPEDAMVIAAIQQANKFKVIENYDKIDAVLRKYEMAPENYGLRSPGVPGLKSAGKKTSEIGRVHKAIANFTPIDEEEKDIYSLM